MQMSLSKHHVQIVYSFIHKPYLPQINYINRGKHTSRMDPISALLHLKFLLVSRFGRMIPQQPGCRITVRSEDPSLRQLQQTGTENVASGNADSQGVFQAGSPIFPVVFPIKPNVSFVEKPLGFPVTSLFVQEAYSSLTKGDHPWYSW